MTLIVASTKISCKCLLSTHDQKFVKLFSQTKISISEFFITFLISITYIIKVYIEHLVAYAHTKSGLEDSFFGHLKLIVWLILVRL